MHCPDFVRNLKILDFVSEDLPMYSLETAHGDINFLMYGATTEFRVRTFFTKEPETLEWIDTFSSGDVFWDIGANIGLYSLYAGARQDISVCSFEPSPVNFYLLAANINVNKIRRIEAYPFGLSDDNHIVKWEGSLSPGEGGTDFQIDKSGKLALQTYSIDRLIMNSSAPFPNHIKLDVDGHERKIIDGAITTLSDIRLKSIMVEVDERDEKTTDYIIQILKRNSFSTPIRRHAPYFDENHYLPICNYLFHRI